MTKRASMICHVDEVTTLLVPLADASLNGNLSSVPPRTWLACGLAMFGILVMGFNPDNLSSISLLPSAFVSITSGDAFILAAAFGYTMHVVRLGRWANRVEPLQLVAAKATWEALISLAVVGALVWLATHVTALSEGSSLAYVQARGHEIIDFFDDLRSRWYDGTLSTSWLRLGAGTVLWSGLISTAFVNYAQSYGQRRIAPASANLIYSLQPLFTAMFAYVLLGETMNAAEFAGASLIGAAVYMVAFEAFNSKSHEARLEMKA